MSRIRGLQEMFKRYRRPGDLVFAWFCMIGSLALISQLSTQAPWVTGDPVFTQPAFWPTVSVMAMAGFAALHLMSSFLSPELEGRWREVLIWVKSLEFAVWFMAYVFVVPLAGYLPTTIVMAVLLALRAGYRSRGELVGMALAGIAIVIAFKSFLQVRIPGGAVYELLPTALRSFMLTYL